MSMFRDPFYGASEWLDMVEDVVDGVVDTGSSVVNYGSEVVSNLKKPFWVDPVVAGYLAAEKYILDNSYDNLVARYSDPVALSNDLNFIVTVAPPATIAYLTRQFSLPFVGTVVGTTLGRGIQVGDELLDLAADAVGERNPTVTPSTSQVGPGGGVDAAREYGGINPEDNSGCEEYYAALIRVGVPDVTAKSLMADCENK